MVTKSEFRVLSEISRDSAQIFLGSTVVGPLFLISESRDGRMTIFGSIMTIVLWWFAIVLGKRGKV